MVQGIPSQEFGRIFCTENGSWLHEVVSKRQIDLKEILPTGLSKLSFNEKGAPEGLGGPEESIYTLTQFRPGKHLAQNEDLRIRMGQEITESYDEYRIRTGKLIPFVGVDEGKKYAGMGGIFTHGLRATIFMGTVADAEGRLFYLYSPYQGPKLESEQDVRKLQMNREHFPQFTRVPVPTEDIRFLDVIIEDLKEGIIPSQSSSDIT